MGSPIDWRPNYSIRAYRAFRAAPSPYYLRDCVGCNSPGEGDLTGVTFSTLDPNRMLCSACQEAL